ncbi:uncharacterized protein JN550_005644 [Neoarthrinium moseri]|uniref:uncharacterized protein n=1 Tax=Neoarthrinium moseri TaxID=1658444 RepID=UPI001FDBDE2E|nr:uncharacterized protein JN550_005644 [Neoarthrinium moseri]KAI1869663.1 hypothetical protein JN550_005644 [Neoarthrinium moseri]
MGSQQHKYENMALDDRDDRSSTEVESLMDGEGKVWHDVDLQRPTRRSRTSRICGVLNSFRWLIDTTLLLIILGFVVRSYLREKPVNPTDYDFLGDMTGVGPKFSQQITTFVNDEDYAPYNTSEFFKPEVLDRWNKLMPLGMGFQWVKEPEKYHDLPKPIEWGFDDEGKEMTVFTTSMTHQLHCLWAIVQTYSGLSSGHEIPEDHHWHMIHCFSYMRQAILCAADTALEGHATTFPKDNSGSDGWDAKHVCKDQSQVRSYLESVRAYSDQQIY